MASFYFWQLVMYVYILYCSFCTVRNYTAGLCWSSGHWDGVYDEWT